MKQICKYGFGLLILALCLSLLTTAKQQQTTNVSPSDDAALRDLVSRFLASYENRDDKSQMQLWNEKSPQYNQQKQVIERLFKRLDKIDVKNLMIQRITVESDNAYVRFDVDMQSSERQFGRPDNGLAPKFAALYFVREDGQWKTTRFTSAVDDLVDAMIAANTAQERSALMASEKLMTAPDFINSLNRKGLRQYSRGEYPEALKIFLISQDLAERSSQKLGLAMTLNNIGVIYHYQGNYALALETFERSLVLAKELKNPEGVAHLTNNLGMIYHAQSNIPLALQYYEESLKQCEDLKDSREIAIRLTNIGGVYQSIGNYSVALDYLNRALKLDEDSKFGIRHWKRKSRDKRCLYRSRRL